MTETSWKIIVQVFSDTKSSPETLLFTVDFGGAGRAGDALQLYPQSWLRRLRLASISEAAVRQYPWTRDTVQDITKSGCGKLLCRSRRAQSNTT